MNLSCKQFTIRRSMAAIGVVTIVVWSSSVLGAALYLEIAAGVLIPAAAVRGWLYLKSRRLLLPVAVSVTSCLSVFLVSLGVVLAVRSLPRGPDNVQDAIRLARSYAHQIKPSYPFDDYEAQASWNGAERCWVVDFVANRPYIHTEIEIDRQTGECIDVPIYYDPVAE